MIFRTKRLEVRSFNLQDEALFFDMMGNENVRNPIPKKTLNAIESKEKLISFIRSEIEEENKVWAVVMAENKELIGLAGFVNNNKDGMANELAYMFRESAWGKGFGAEIAEGLVNHGFQVLGFEEIRADVSIKNIGSVKILDKFLNREKQVYNSEDKCWDMKYKISRNIWETN